MELKNYQQEAITDLERFLENIQETKDVYRAYNNFWTTHPLSPVQPFPGKPIEPYKDNIVGVPHICFKIPTAGGKTFVACNAIHSIFNAFHYHAKKAVVWLVPSITILEQTINNLKDTTHPYRQKINSHFGNKVAVFDKADLLNGTGLNPSSVSEQLNILVLSFDSLRAKNKEERKVYQENGNLQPFAHELGDREDISLMRVIQSLNPVVIVDESHNAETDLSVDMLKNLNPCFILDLTATPRKNSNIISFVDAIELKKANMVKLPVICYNHSDKSEVINSALQLRHKLEAQAIEEQKKGGRYIRPIVLFQAQPRNAEDNTTFEKLKAQLIELKIPEEQIKIKTASINEIKGLDLMSPDCPVRYIITINALKEGWDCPFAYILASLADKSSAVDVEQILGRVLRQPYVTKHQFPLLNLCYVLTASAKFLETLDNIVKGLNRAGFSDQDYKMADPLQVEIARETEKIDQLNVFTQSTVQPNLIEQTEDIDLSKITPIDQIGNHTVGLTAIEETAVAEVINFEKRLDAAATNNHLPIPTVLEKMVKSYSIKPVFQETASKIYLPQFYLQLPFSDMFGGEKLLEKEELIEQFKLAQEDTKISFENISSELYKIDLDETRQGHTPSFLKIDGKFKESILSYILDPSRKEERVKNFSKRLVDQIGKLDPIPEVDILKYVQRILENFTDEQFNDLASKEYSYARKIKEKIRDSADRYSEKNFFKYLDIDKVFIKPSYQFPEQIIPGATAKDITKSLYEKEGEMNDFEESVINAVANMHNIAFWTRNIERRGFCINGFINHYPDFIIHTKSGKTIVLETKGDHLDAEQKIRLGEQWAKKAGNHFRYFMVYQNRKVEGAYTQDAFLETISMI
ncbi:MAG: restriction endonuclease [Chitinophagaceae bacterium BSSC1]|nr:MAG: restriction endonuclease [Chitinophagaceae bacterium BSSC1]